MPPQPLRSIRKAMRSESAILSNLAFDSKSYWGYSAEFMDQCRDELAVSERDLCSPELLYRVCENDGEILGFYAIAPVSDHEAELDALFVKPGSIGQGIGKALISHAVSLARGNGFKALVIQGDPHAEPFYLAAGAERIGQRESGSIKGRYLPLFRLHLGRPGAAGP